MRSWFRSKLQHKGSAARPPRRTVSVKLRLDRFEERIVPTFVTTNYTAGLGAASVATGNFQGASDGAVDFATANIGAGTVSVFLNNHDGSGTFRAGQTITVPRAIDIAAGDLTGDGLDDLVVTSANTPGTVSILMNDPNNPGTFQAPVVLQLGQDFPLDVRLADMNGDGFLDIITANYDANSVSVLLNNGDGTFAAPQSYLAGSHFGTYSLAVADFYGDGFPSVAVGNFQTGAIDILRGNGDGTLQPYHQVAQVTGFVSGLAAGDLGNGAVDLVTANNDGDGESVLLNDGAGNFTVHNIASTQSDPLRVALGDINGDGNLDIVTDNFGTSNPGTISVLYGNGDGTFQAPQLVNSGGNQPSAVVVADVEGDAGNDGLNDLIVSNNASASVTVLTNTPAPTVQSTTLTGEHNGTVSDDTVVFTSPIDPNTFTPDQYVLMDPNGNTVNVTGITATDGTNTRFHVTFDPQTTIGTYTLTIGPNIYDPTDTFHMPAAFHSTFTITNNLLLNGGFETGSFAPWVQSGDTGATGVSSAVPVHSGTYAAEFGPVGLGYITQTVSTTPGQTYQLSFWLDHPFTDTGTEFQVIIGGTTVDDQVNVGNFPYTQYTYTYTATSSTTSIQLGFQEPPSFFYLDDVVFQPTGTTHAGGSSPGLVGPFGLGVSTVQGQQASAAAPVERSADANRVGSGVVAQASATAAGSVAPVDAKAYHVAAANALAVDAVLGELFHDAL